MLVGDRVRHVWFVVFVLALTVAFAGTARDSLAASSFVGPEKCNECHKAEFTVWTGTPHFKSFKEVHKNKKARAIVKAIGEKRMKRADLCASCHYTVAPKKAGGKPSAIAGPSCESCHGPASEWIETHNDYGGKGVKREDETAEHKAQRIAAATAAGMIWPTQLYDVAANCNECHGLAREDISGDHIKAMLDNEHPINPGFELVAYSQGSVRHRFYPPDVTVNQEMSDVEKARLYIVGQAATLVSASAALAKSDHPKYVEAQNQRIATATEALKAIEGQIPEAGALLAAPTEDNARALANAIGDKDLTGAVGSRLPSSYK